MKTKFLLRNMLGIAIISLLICCMFIIGCDDNDNNPVIDSNSDTLEQSFTADDFDDAESCRSCHPIHYDEWSGSMHAYSLVDPVLAKVRAIGQSAYPGALEGACVQCHSPIGKMIGELPWGEFQFDQLSPITKEGIGCDMCHTITSIGRLSNGGVNLTPGNIKYGTIEDPAPNSAHESEFRSLYSTSEYCGACHDFVTDDGLELETTFREWRSSGFAMTGKECNDCHMPEYTGPAAAGGEDRTVHRHTFPGVDLAFIDFPNKPEQLQIATELLQSALTMNLNLFDTARVNEQYDFSISLINDKTAHAVPSGVPFNRQMWLSIVAQDGANNVLFSTGQLDANNDLMDGNSEFGVIDTNLFNAQATMFRADGQPTGNTWDATSLDNPAIQAGETRTIDYSFMVPSNVQGDITIDVTLRFRSFAPYLFRNLELDSLLPIPIIDMNSDKQTITVQ